MNWKKATKKHYPAFLMIIVSIALWQFLVKLFHIETWILPAPTDIIKAFKKEYTYLLDNTLVTVYEALVGFLFAILIALILAVIIDQFSFFKRGFYPILIASQTVPIIAVAPLLMIWFGYGLLPKFVVVSLVCFFPIVLSTVDGFNQADSGLITLLQTMNATKWQVFKKVRFPSALPSFFSGLRIAATYSIMGAVIGEWLGANKGLGIYMKNASHSFLTDQVFAAILIIVFTSILFYGVLLLIEQNLIPWAKLNDGE